MRKAKKLKLKVCSGRGWLERYKSRRLFRRKKEWMNGS